MISIAQGLLFFAIAVAFLVLAYAFLRLARIFSTTESTIKEVSHEVVPLIGKTHVTVDNINSQLSQLDTAVGDVTDITGELDQTTTAITQGIRGGVIKVSSATTGVSRGIGAFFARTREEPVSPGGPTASSPAAGSPAAAGPTAEVTGDSASGKDSPSVAGSASAGEAR